MVTLITELKKIVEDRGHELVHFKVGKKNPDSVPQVSIIQLKCTHCGNSWATRLQVYLSRTSTSGGCRQCYTKNLQNPKLYPNSPFQQRQDTLDRPARRAGVQKLRNTNKKGQYASIRSREDLIKFLQQNSNKHNDYVLPLVLRDTNFPKRRNELPPGQYSFHHVIPLHDKGSPDSWNLIYVTKEEHYVVHKLRFEVYKQQGDSMAIRATQSDFEKVSNPASSEEILEARETAKKLSRRRTLLLRRNPQTLRAIQEGMLWRHERTGVSVLIKPDSVETIQDIKELLIANLPEEDWDRQKMLSNISSSNNYIRQHVDTVFKTDDFKIKKPRQRAYGFVVQSLNFGKNNF
uniref:Putative site-specific DNA endonuclease n=1 Tax=Stigeoclonium helveticum TaxID=55999 RepID=Q06SD1_STIHE|nr:putative site-specific DNA endonuclease [Stigeoclonium helveticum]ABF60221.1 putative site-specific DNA endonuclease [Stigeoclonium helveticum]